MLGRLFGSGDIKIMSPLSGEVMMLKEVNDEVFSEGILGKGAAIKPDGGRVVSPVDGVVSQMFETGHAVTLTSNGGTEILIHIGLDTVKLKGLHFVKHANTGDKVRAGDPLVTFDHAAIEAAGYDSITPIIICNSDDYGSLRIATAKHVNELDELIIIKK